MNNINGACAVFGSVSVCKYCCDLRQYGLMGVQVDK